MAERFSQKDARRALDRLTALQSKPSEQAAYAAEMLAATSHPEVVQSAFRALSRSPEPGALEAVRSRIAALERNPKADPGGMLRAAGIQALAPISTQQDLPDLLRWTRFYERSMQDSSRGGAVRAAALPGLARLDSARAVFEAIRLLGDTKHTSEFTGEPGLTAARVLAELGETAVLYAFIYTAAGPNDDVLAEAFRGLESFPPEIIDDIVQEFGQGRLSDAGEAGVIDLVLASPPRDVTARYVSGVLASERYDLYGFAVTTLAASRNPGWLELLVKAAESTDDRSKLYMLQRALPLAARDPAVAAALATVEAKRAALRLGTAPSGENTEDPES